MARLMQKDWLEGSIQRAIVQGLIEKGQASMPWQSSSGRVMQIQHFANFRWPAGDERYNPDELMQCTLSDGFSYIDCEMVRELENRLCVDTGLRITQMRGAIVRRVTGTLTLYETGSRKRSALQVKLLVQDLGFEGNAQGAIFGEPFSVHSRPKTIQLLNHPNLRRQQSFFGTQPGPHAGDTSMDSIATNPDVISTQIPVSRAPLRLDSGLHGNGASFNQPSFQWQARSTSHSTVANPAAPKRRKLLHSGWADFRGLSYYDTQVPAEQLAALQDESCWRPEGQYELEMIRYARLKPKPKTQSKPQPKVMPAAAVSVSQQPPHTQPKIVKVKAVPKETYIRGVRDVEVVDNSAYFNAKRNYREERPSQQAQDDDDDKPVSDWTPSPEQIPRHLLRKARTTPPPCSSQPSPPSQPRQLQTEVLIPGRLPPPNVPRAQSPISTFGGSSASQATASIPAKPQAVPLSRLLVTPAPRSNQRPVQRTEAPPAIQASPGQVSSASPLRHGPESASMQINAILSQPSIPATQVVDPVGAQSMQREPPSPRNEPAKAAAALPTTPIAATHASEDSDDGSLPELSIWEDPPAKNDEPELQGGIATQPNQQVNINALLDALSSPAASDDAASFTSQIDHEEVDDQEIVDEPISQEPADAMATSTPQLAGEVHVPDSGSRPSQHSAAAATTSDRIALSQPVDDRIEQSIDSLQTASQATNHRQPASSQSAILVVPEENEAVATEVEAPQHEVTDHDPAIAQLSDLAPTESVESVVTDVVPAAAAHLLQEAMPITVEPGEQTTIAAVATMQTTSIPAIERSTSPTAEPPVGVTPTSTHKAEQAAPAVDADGEFRTNDGSVVEAAADAEAEDEDAKYARLAALNAKRRAAAAASIARRKKARLSKSSSPAPGQRAAAASTSMAAAHVPATLSPQQQHELKQRQQQQQQQQQQPKIAPRFVAAAPSHLQAATKSVSPVVKPQRAAYTLPSPGVVQAHSEAQRVAKRRLEEGRTMIYTAGSTDYEGDVDDDEVDDEDDDGFVAPPKAKRPRLASPQL